MINAKSARSKRFQIKFIVYIFQRVTDVKYFSISYWLLALTIMFFYNGVFPFVADST